MYNSEVKKLIWAIVALILITIFAAGCVDDPPPVGGDQPSDNETAELPFETVTENGKTYTYLGSAYSAFVGVDLNRVLSNLYDDGMLTGQDEVYNYAGTEYLRVQVTDDTAGRTLGGMTLTEGQSCFFKKAPLKFRLVNETDTEAMLIPAVIYEYRYFNLPNSGAGIGYDYDTSSLKTYLEGDFLTNTFSDAERSNIISIRLMTLSEAKSYVDVYSDDPVQFYAAAASELLVAAEPDINAGEALGNTASWWLDSAGKEGNCGVVDRFGTLTDVTVYSEQGLRPLITFKKV